jgi:pyruvate/2-oxoacid:ferredoxin oxidoreductase alpha subunit
MMINMDAFVLSHTYMDAEVPTREEVSRFLPPYEPLWKLDPRKPVTHGSVIYPVDFSETRESMQLGQANARVVARQAAEEFREMFGRWHGAMVDTYQADDAEFLILAMGSLAAESKVAVDLLRKEGEAVGLLRVRFFRPFPFEELREICSGREGLLVIDRNYSYGMEGALFTEMKAALYGHEAVSARNLIVGLGGRDVTYELIAEYVRKARAGELEDITWGDSHITRAHEITREVLCEFEELLSEGES